MINIHTVSENQVWDTSSERLIEIIKQNSSKKILLLLSGGSVVGMYGNLVRWIKDKKIRDKFAMGQVDERFKPNGEWKMENARMNIDINANAIWKTGLWEVCEERKIPYFTITQEGTFEESARMYNARMHECMNEYTFKMAILGIGEDGHTAGLLPGYAKGWDKERWIVGYEISNIKYQISNIRKRITLTPKALRGLDYALVAAIGENKKDALEKIVKDIKDANIDKTPGLILREIQKVDLVTDQVLD